MHRRRLQFRSSRASLHLSLRAARRLFLLSVGLRAASPCSWLPPAALSPRRPYGLTALAKHLAVHLLLLGLLPRNLRVDARQQLGDRLVVGRELAGPLQVGLGLV